MALHTLKYINLYIKLTFVLVTGVPQTQEVLSPPQFPPRQSGQSVEGLWIHVSVGHCSRELPWSLQGIANDGLVQAGSMELDLFYL